MTRALKKVLRLRYLDGNFRLKKQRHIQVKKKWIQQINHATSYWNNSYSGFIATLKTVGVRINRNLLSQLAVTEPASFRGLVGLQEIARYGKFNPKAVDTPRERIGWRPPLDHELHPKQKSFTYQRQSLSRKDRGLGKRLL